MKLYIAIDRSDEYELIVAVADSAEELADMVGVNANTIRSSLCKVRKGTYKNSQYMEVEIE